MQTTVRRIHGSNRRCTFLRILNGDELRTSCGKDKKQSHTTSRREEQPPEVTLVMER